MYRLLLKINLTYLDIEANYPKTAAVLGVKQKEKWLAPLPWSQPGHNAGAIRKMFVKKEFRGKETGMAQRLLGTLIDHCRTMH